MSSLSLGGALLAAIATRVTVATGPMAGIAGAPIQNRANAAFARALRVLLTFDAAETSETGCPVLAVDSETMRRRWRIAPTDPRLEDLIAAYLALACHYDGLPSGLSWFRPPDTCAEAMRLFAAEGYAQVEADLYCWSPLIGGHMDAAGVRSTARREPDDGRLERQEADALKAYADMPIFIRRRFFSGPEVDLLAFQNVVAHCWDGTRWRPFTRERRYLDFPDARQLSERMVALAVHSRSREQGPR